MANNRTIEENPAAVAAALATLDAMIASDEAQQEDAASTTPKKASDAAATPFKPRPDMETGLASRLAFMRWAKFDAAKACQRRKVYWAYRASLFQDSNGELPAADDLRVATALGLGFAELPVGARDREGRQVVLVRLCRVDYTVVTPEQVCQAFWYLQHAAHGHDFEEDANGGGGDLTQRQGLFVVNNMAGVERKNINRTTMALLASSLQDVLPVRVGGIRILNQPWFFSWAWALVSPFLRAKLRSRVAVLGNNHAALLAWLEPSCIPVELGGKLAWNHNAWLQRRALADALN
jgi:hypothetical protein